MCVWFGFVCGWKSEGRDDGTEEASAKGEEEQAGEEEGHKEVVEKSFQGSGRGLSPPPGLIKQPLR